MAASSPTTGQASLKDTPTWAVAVVCAIFIILSLVIEHALHLFTKVFPSMNSYTNLYKYTDNSKYAIVSVWDPILYFLGVKSMSIPAVSTACVCRVCGHQICMIIYVRLYAWMSAMMCFHWNVRKNIRACNMLWIAYWVFFCYWYVPWCFCQFLGRRKRKALNQALNKIKAGKTLREGCMWDEL